MRGRLATTPIATSAGMNLGDFGPRGTQRIVAQMECAIIYRFGIRRLMWRRWVLHRLRRRACFPDNGPPPRARNLMAIDRNQAPTLRFTCVGTIDHYRLNEPRSVRCLPRRPALWVHPWAARIGRPA